MTCAFVECAAVQSCCLPGGCVTRRYGPAAPRRDATRGHALTGTKPARASRDPRFVKRRRKVVLRR